MVGPATIPGHMVAELSLGKLCVAVAEGAVCKRVPNAPPPSEGAWGKVLIGTWGMQGGKR